MRAPRPSQGGRPERPFCCMEKNDEGETVSLDATRWAWQQSLRPTEKLVLLSLADRADELHSCYPSLTRVSQDTGLDIKTVRKVIHELVSRNILAAQESPGRGYKYQLSGVIGRHETTTKSGTPTKSGTTTKNGRTTPTKSGTPPLPKVVPESTSNLPVEAPKRLQGTPDGDAQPPKKATPKPQSAETWRAYAQAYEARYGVQPVRNASVNGQLANLVKRLGQDEAPLVAAFYLSHNHTFYVSAGHSVGALLKDAEKLRTEWATGRKTTQAKARQVDRAQSNYDAGEEAKAILRGRTTS